MSLLATKHFVVGAMLPAGELRVDRASIYEIQSKSKIVNKLNTGVLILFV